MSTKARKQSPEIILKNGKPCVVILDIDAYQEMLERLEDVDDLKMLQEMRQSHSFQEARRFSGGT